MNDALKATVSRTNFSNFDWIIVTLALFTGMAVWVTIGGGKDLRQMCRDLEEKRDRDQN